MKATKDSKSNSFDSALGALGGGGVDALFTTDAGNPNEYEIMVDLADIEVTAQVRGEMEDEENRLSELAETMKEHGQIQSILIRPRDGAGKAFHLVVGERRYRAASLAGWKQIRARVRDLTDEQAEEIQFIENVQRKNLTQIEEAAKVQRDLDALGNVDAVLAKHKKGRAWLSKILALLHLPEHTKRLVSENITADLEVINTVKVVEKSDPKAAAKLVDDLKSTRGKENARDKANAAKDKVKPKKDGGNLATPKDRSEEAPSDVTIFAPAKKDKKLGTIADKLSVAYLAIADGEITAKKFFDAMPEGEKADAESNLRVHYVKGQKCKDVARAVMVGLRDGSFGLDCYGALAMSAFLYGTKGAEFSLLDVLGSVKP